MTGRPDLRLAGVAAGTWLSALSALYAGVAATVAAVAVAAGLAATTGWLLVRGDRGAASRPATRRPGHRGWGWVFVAALLGVVCGGAATAARLTARDAEPLAGLARRGAPVHAELVVRDDPRLVGGGAGRPTYAVPADLVRLLPGTGAGGRDGPAIRLAARVLVLGGHPTWRGLLPGQRALVEGRLLPPRGGDLRAAALAVTGAPALVGSPGWAQRAAGALRAGLQRACAPLPAEPGGLLPGLVVGDTSRLDPAVAEDFRATGLTHLCAVSGANVAIVVGLVLLLARRSRAGPVVAAVACGVALVGFVILARPSPSVVRAGTMGAIGLLALATGRSRAAVPALGAAVTALVCHDPELAGHPGFVLSVLATGGLLLLAPRWRDAMRARGVPAGVAEAIAVPAAAQVACGPVVAALSGTVSAVAVPANLLAVPAIAPATVLGVAAAAVSPVWPDAAEALAWLAAWPARWLVVVAREGADLPAGTLPWPGGASGGLLLGAVTVVALLAARRPVARRLAAVVAAAVVLGSLPVRLLAAGWPPPGWVFVACAVGQGDALVLNAGPGAAVVVDAGPEPAATDRCLRRLGVRRVAALVLSHLHVDHVGGVAGVFRGRPVGAVVVGGWPEPAYGRAQVTRVAAGAGTPVVVVGAGWSYAAGDLRLSALAPARPLRGTRSDPNNNSLVLRATVDGVGVLLTGDAEGEQQRALLDEAPRNTLRSPVLKLAHHGSQYQDVGFLDAVDPALVVVSVGAGNRYGHPNRALLARLARDGARVLRTDRDGDVAAVHTVDGLAAVVRGRDPGTPAAPRRRRREPPRPVRTPAPRRSSDTSVLAVCGDLRCRSGDRRRRHRSSCDDGRVTPAPPPAVVLVLGDEELLVARAVTRTVEAARAADPAADVREHEAGSLAPGEIAELLSPSLFGGRRVLVIRAGQDAKKDLSAALVSYAANPDPDVTLVVTHAGAAKGKALADGLKGAGAAVLPAAKIARHRERVDFVRDEIRRLGGRAGEDAAEALLAAVGNDLRELSAACSQLIADTDGRIGADTVARYYRGRAEVTGFTVADAAMVGDVPGALEALRWALHVGVDPVPIADAIADGVRTVARVASAGRGSPYQLASSLGMPAWKIERAQRQGRGWTPEALVTAMLVAAECNAAVKGAAEDRGYALEQAVFAVAAARRGEGVGAVRPGATTGAATGGGEGGVRTSRAGRR